MTRMLCRRRAAALVLFGSALLLLGGTRIASVGSFAAGCNGDVEPKAVVASRRQHLGKLVQGEVREVCFVVRNAGRKRLVITGENRACCGQAADSSSLVAMPGDSVDLRTEIDTSRWFGQLREELSYRTNDPQQPRLTFTVVGEVVTSVRHPASP